MISVVSFDYCSEVLVPCALVDDGSTVVRRLETLFARGSTALHQGWLDTCQQVQRGASKHRLSRVILLSDGQANAGLVDSGRIAAQVAEWQRDGITTSTVGLGLGYNEDLLSAMAQAGNGNFHHVANPRDIEPSFHVEMQSLLNCFGREVSLDVAGLNGVELIRVINPLQRTPKGRAKLADLVHGNPIDVVMEFLVPAQMEEQDLVRFRLAWTDVQTGHRHAMKHSLRLPVVPHGQLAEFPVNVEVMHKRAVQLSARVLKEAARAIERSDIATARKALEKGLESLREAGDSPELRQHVEQLSRMLRSLDTGSYNEVRKQAVSSFSSVSMGSVVLSGGVRQWMALPEHERTPEKLNELMGFLNPPQS
jgi:Ca-activated chloride channel family protein